MKKINFRLFGFLAVLAFSTMACNPLEALKVLFAPEGSEVIVMEPGESDGPVVNNNQDNPEVTISAIQFDWDAFCLGKIGYVYDTGRLPAKAPCQQGTVYVTDAPWNDGHTNDGEFYFTTDYAKVLDIQEQYPNGSVWATDTLEFFANTIGEWCTGEAPIIIENTETYTSCPGDVVYVVVEPWNLQGVTHVGERFEFDTIKEALAWLEKHNLDHGSIWVELVGLK